MYLKYMYKQDLTSNNLEWLICQKPQPTETDQTKPSMDIKRQIVFMNMRFLSEWFVGNFLNEFNLICLHTVNWF